MWAHWSQACVTTRFTDDSRNEPAMNDHPTTETTADAGNNRPADDQADARFGDDLGDIAVEPPGTVARPRLPLLLAALALLLSILALGSSAWLLAVSGSDPGEELATTAYVDRLAADIRGTEAATRSLQQRVDEFAAARNSGSSDLEEAERRFEQRLRSFEDIEGRVSGVESSFAALKGISTGVRDSWLLAEAEYYMQIANAQVQLAGNPELAALALGLADETLRAIPDPGLIEVRRALAEELQRLEAVDRPDVEGATLTLASLASVASDLPLGSQLQAGAAADVDAAPGPGLEGTDRALASLKNAISGIVTVRRSDEDVRPLMAPEAAYFLRANLSLQLQAARIGLLRGEQAIFQASLDDALAWLHEYYDVESAPVQSALLTISEIRNSVFTAALPDISNSLRLLRAYSAFRAATERTGDGRDAGQPQ